MTERDDDGIILYDSTDDMDEIELAEESGDTFTDEYMLQLAESEERKIARAKHIDRMVSAGVVVGIILLVALFVWLFF